jgi:hypothetical protein
VTVADVARLLPRHWDGQRLLRFLTGLALLALAFAAHAGVTAVPPAAVPAAAVPPAAALTVAVPAVAPAAVAQPLPVPAAAAPATPAEAVAIPADRPARAGDVLRIGVQSKAGAGFATMAVAFVVGLFVVAGIRTVGRPAGPVGVVTGAFGSRGPPLAG